MTNFAPNQPADNFNKRYEEAERLVRNEVYYCVSSLISELMTNEKYMDELYEHFIAYDYEEAANYHIFNEMDREELIEYLQSETIAYDIENESLKELQDMVWDYVIESDYLEGFCEEFSLEPELLEIYEYWIVSDWLADKLLEAGEVVHKDFLGLTIWGRCTSDGSIACDSVIQRIAVS